MPPGWQDVPTPLPGSTPNFTFVNQVGVSPWALRSWAGYVKPTAYSGGGIAVAPDSARGVIRVWTWWPNAAALQLVRVTADGTRRPVRGAFPAVPSTPTRQNLCTNPSVEVSLSGYIALNAQTTLSRPSVSAPAGTYVMRMVSTSTTTGALIPGTLPGPGAFTIAFNLAASTRPSGVTVTVPWLDASGASAGTTTINLPADQINNSVGQTARHVLTAVAPSGAVTGSVTLTITGVTASVTTVDFDAVVIERNITDGTYFDGTSTGGNWTGTPGLSISQLAPVLIVDDGEAPFDTTLTYEAYNPSLTGGRVASVSVVLASTGLTWLTHPAAPSQPLTVQLSAPTPARTYDVDQGVFYPVGRARPVVVSAAQRHAATGTLTFGALTRAELRSLLDTFADLSPVLLRVPGDYDPSDMWVVLGALTVDPQGRLPYQDTRLISAPFTEVDPPDAALAA
ncbi:hypothetical protein [Lentzea kentuckyensis]|uniref:hypothetical protein n=1 Tax=Lentzea kentuckyensis TaxID=360086 RepID=UPI00117BB6C4|nr:hypothetical protein [Lentzea kentuckyensis]